MSAAATLAAPPMLAGDHARVLDRITDAGVELAVWHRSRPPGLAWLDGLGWDGVGDLDIEAPVAALEAKVADGLAEAGHPEDERGVALRDHVAGLARRLAGIVGCTAVRVRLEVIETDACRRFHSDLVTARLLTTLVGPATQWIETAAPDALHQLGPGDVAIFKGRRWAEQPAILHRSPPIAGTGDTRLLLAIDPLDPAGDDAHG